MEHPNNLLACRTAARLSQMKVAAALEVSQSEYSRMELGRRQVGAHADKLAEIFDVTVEKLLEYKGSNLETAPPENGYVIMKLPVYGKRVVGKHSMFIVEQEPIEMVDKPASLAANKDAYGVYVPGDSMEPRIKTGDLVYVEPHQPVRKNDLVVIGYDQDGPREILEFCGYQDGKVKLCRANPEDEMLVDENDVQIMDRISGVKFL